VLRMDQRRWAQATSMWGRRCGQMGNRVAANPAGGHVQEIRRKIVVRIGRTPERTV